MPAGLSSPLPLEKDMHGRNGDFDWYADRGLQVFPVQTNGKKAPAIKRSWKDAATSQLEEIQELFSGKVGAGVGVALGKWEGKGNVFALDIDIAEDDGPGGAETWKEIRQAQAEPVPETLCARTPSGGVHLYFRAPPGVKVKSVTDGLGPNVDVKGHGGYVVAPPTEDPRGAYKWENGKEIAPAPFWLVSMVAKDAGGSAAETEKKGRRAATLDSSAGARDVSRGQSNGHEDLALIEDALSAIPPNPNYNRWVRIIAAVKDAAPTMQVAERLLEKWSPENRGDYTYSERLRNAPDKEISAGTLFYLAEQAGWTPPWAGSGDGSERKSQNGASGSPSGGISSGGNSSGGSFGGGGASSGSDEAGTGGSGESPWARIRLVYEDSRQDGRFEAGDQAADDLEIRTDADSGQMHAWRPESGIFDDRAGRLLQAHLRSNLGPLFSTKELREIEAHVRASTYTSRLETPGYVPLKNGDLSLETFEIEEMSPDRGYLSRSKAAWDPEAECPVFDHFLEESVPDERHRETLREYVGYCLLHRRLPLHKALFIVGPTNSGKSTFLSVVTDLLGSTCSLELEQLIDNRFGASSLDGAWANIRQDVSAGMLRDIGLFKEITAGDPIYVEEKREKGYELRPTAKHLYSANRLPSLEIDDDAFFRRVLIVGFPSTVPKPDRDPSLPGRLKGELDGVLQWAVEGLRRLREQEEFTGDLPPDETRHLWNQWSSSVGRFKAAALKITGSDEDYRAKSDIYSAYKAYCEKAGLSAESQQVLTKSLKRDSRISDSQRRIGGSKKRVYVGLRLREDTSSGDQGDSGSGPDTHFAPGDDVPF